MTASQRSYYSAIWMANASVDDREKSWSVNVKEWTALSMTDHATAQEKTE